MILSDPKFTEIKLTCEPRSRSDLSPMQHINQVPRFSLSLRRLPRVRVSVRVRNFEMNSSTLCRAYIGGRLFSFKIRVAEIFQRIIVAKQ